MKKKIIEITNLEKTFASKVILKDVNWSVEEGERVAILGANGAGKTTFVEMISQVSKPTKGKIKINLDGNIKSQIGIQFQQGDWIPGLNAQDLLEFYHHLFPEFSEKREKELAEIFEINEFRKTSLTKLSGGQKQRFNAMLSVLNKPKIVILDELTVGLDMELQFKILNFFKKSTKEEKQTLLIVSHNAQEVEMLCTRMIIIGNQGIFFDDSIKNVQKNYGGVRNLMDNYFRKELKNGKK
ncbi:ABC transporter ATP-binding protein [Spiroplasma platyhelix]|uniref:ABC transporter ATP-binding protein n=1 Tax=Spiroplasma platyhelix PALS-1 TaxID=1276218 RepID=A0A846U1E8_9MOLU|nr:ABC transporter ATP-binding protein [Spiroplasma platyhelix]MBE4704263.1 ABC transporter ATP-binding protein YtrB [Spiroplasma platyhelix PALS-1]NKE38636.1 ABC transporter ATP-binding protein [Spiroplasma platyhelix PALS-1]UJB28847.1 ABC transporter ATP-binding protein [Spiroplasma platyhelix PALS-1]